MKRMNKYGEPTAKWMAMTPQEQDLMIARSEEILKFNNEFARLVDKYPESPAETLLGLLDYTDKRTNQLMVQAGIDPEEFKSKHGN